MMYGWAVVCLCGLATGTETNWELLSAVQSGNATGVQMLLSSGSFDNNHMRFIWEGGMEDTMVHQAARQGHAEVLQLLLDAWPEGVQARDYGGAVPLHRAFWSDNADVVAPLLLKQWPDGVKAADSTGSLPLHWAVSDDSDPDPEMAQLLLKQWPDAVKAADSQGFLPLHLAVLMVALHDNLEVTQLLLDEWPGALKVASRNFAYPPAGLPLHLAAYTGNLELVQLLVEGWPEGLNVVNSHGRTPFDVAVYFGHEQEARWILQRDPPSSYTHKEDCAMLIELACNSSEVSSSWKDAARDLRCSNVESLSRPTLQLWLDDCGGNPQWADVFGTLADRIEDPEAKDQHINQRYGFNFHLVLTS